ncbi:MAG: hypothetical protein ACSW8K_11805, partial [bacterium]
MKIIGIIIRAAAVPQNNKQKDWGNMKNRKLMLPLLALLAAAAAAALILLRKPPGEKDTAAAGYSPQAEKAVEDFVRMYGEKAPDYDGS